MLALTARRQALDEGRHVVLDANLRPRAGRRPTRAVATVQGCVPGAALLKCNRAEAQRAHRPRRSRRRGGRAARAAVRGRSS